MRHLLCNKPGCHQAALVSRLVLSQLFVIIAIYIACNWRLSHLVITIIWSVRSNPLKTLKRTDLFESLAHLPYAFEVMDGNFVPRSLR